MRAVIQRTARASVTVNGSVIGAIGQGLVILLGIHSRDGLEQIRWMADKVLNLRIFEDDEGKMNRSLTDTGGQLLIVSQFTLYGDCRKGRRPGYSDAAPPEIAEPLYEAFIAEVRNRGVTPATGRFQADMQLELVGDGPVTLLLDSEKKF